MESGANAFVFTYYRVQGAAILLILVLVCVPSQLPENKGLVPAIKSLSQEDIFRVVQLGLLLAAMQLMFCFASDLLPAITCAVFMTTVPLTTGLISMRLGIEQICVYKLSSIFCLIAGAIVVIVLGKHTFGG